MPIDLVRPMTVYIRDTVRHRVKLYAAKNKLTMRSAIHELLQAGMRQRAGTQSATADGGNMRTTNQGNK